MHVDTYMVISSHQRRENMNKRNIALLLVGIFVFASRSIVAVSLWIGFFFLAGFVFKKLDQYHSRKLETLRSEIESELVHIRVQIEDATAERKTAIPE